MNLGEAASNLPRMLRGSRDLSRASPKLIYHERRKKGSHSLNKQIVVNDFLIFLPS